MQRILADRPGNRQNPARPAPLTVAQAWRRPLLWAGDRCRLRSVPPVPGNASAGGEWATRPLLYRCQATWL